MFFKQTMSVNIHTREKSLEYSQLLLLYAKPLHQIPSFFHAHVVACFGRAGRRLNFLRVQLRPTSTAQTG